MAFDEVSIGSLRWPVTIVREVHTPTAATASMTKSYEAVTTTRANILPVGALAYWTAATPGRAVQIGEQYTHRIIMRWQPVLDRRHQVHRTTKLPNGDTFVERYQIQRIKNLDGRNRFIEIEAKLLDAAHS